MNPRPPGSTVLPGMVDRYWLRRGEVRILYRVLDARELVQVLRISHRGDIYRRASPAQHNSADRITPTDRCPGADPP